MAEKHDVTARLADGMPAVLTVQQYVVASAQVGYQHPDLTVHAGQLQDWYRSEDGMDLEALNHDYGALEAAASAAAEAMEVQDRQRAALPDVWQGAGAAVSAEFLRRHSDASATVTAALHTAREAVEVLREQLWEAVDKKVGVVIEIEGRAAMTRTEWSAAAATVTSGVGDRSTASEIVDQAVKPFVDSAIRTDWLAAMRNAMSSVTTAYRQATGDIAGARLADFAIPGDLGPVWSAPSTPPSDDRPDEKPWSVASMPAPAPVVGSAGGVTAPAVPAPATVPASWLPPTPATLAAPAEMPPAVPSLGSAGPALPGLGGGGGLSGLGQPFADALSGLLGGGGGLPDPPPLDVPELDDPADTVELEDDDPDESDEDAVAAPEDDAEGDPGQNPDENAEGDPEEPGEGAAGEPPAEPMPAPTPPPPTEPPPPAEPLPPVADADVDERTPCEIAADELPQVGESQPSEPGGG